MAKEPRPAKQTVADYYREEYEYLMQRGKAFAREFGRLMPFFQEHERFPDPHVNRVLEGVAFLTAKLNKAFDDNRGHLAMQFLRVFWPQFLRPIPSVTLVEFKPRPAMSVSFEVARGYELESRAVVRTEQSNRAMFQIKYSTAETVVVNPLLVDFARLEGGESGLRLRLGFRTVRGVNLAALSWQQPMRLQLTATDDFELYGAYEDIRYHCSEGHRNVEIRCPADGAAQSARARIVFPDPLRLPALFPGLTTVFPGFRVLQEFFVLPVRFLTFEVHGLEALSERKEDDSFELVIPFNRRQKNRIDWKVDNLRLHCVPVANLFTGPTGVQLYTGESRRLQLPPGGFPNAEGCSIYLLKQVVLRHYSDRQQVVIKESDFSMYDSADETGERTPEPAYSLDYEFAGSSLDQQKPGAVPSDAAADAQVIRKLYLMLRDVEAPRSPAEAYSLSAEALWCNHDINSLLKQIHVSQGAPEPLMCENLLTPTRYSAPREPSFWHWRLVDLMSLNYLSIQSVEGFRQMLEIFLADTSADNRVFLNSLLELTVEQKQFWEQRIPVNGLLFIFRVADELFKGRRGQLLAFYDLIHSFLTHYVSINSRVELRVVLNTTNETLAYWPPIPGGRVAL